LLFSFSLPRRPPTSTLFPYTTLFRSFLNPTAKPTPRRTPSPRVVLPAPPGSRIASRGSSSGSGSVIAAQRLITSATGSEPVIGRSEEHTSELQSRSDLVCRLLLEKKK